MTVYRPTRWTPPTTPNDDDFEELADLELSHERKRAARLDAWAEATVVCLRAIVLATACLAAVGLLAGLWGRSVGRDGWQVANDAVAAQWPAAAALAACVCVWHIRPHLPHWLALPLTLIAMTAAGAAIGILAFTVGALIAVAAIGCVFALVLFLGVLF